MRASFVLLATMVVTHFATSGATVGSDQAKISMMASPDLVRSLENDGAVAKRSLREHKHHKHHKHYEESEAEERGGGFPGSSGLKSLLGGSSKAAKEAAKQAALEKEAAQKIAQRVLENPNTLESAYRAWKGKYTLSDLQRVLDLDNNPQFVKVYDSIMFRGHIQ
ncbi:hypothetical protein PHYBOEH_005654 [Phytophthora boehmeriae]|uniref:RxLR effector protein n=1 Tax=Phytophthora boehmeriae TaxID=109152 RepID=A0A8T1WJP3_9STRA|nr:hypothetical protein PHYBOEH_005654 [Phytophthora boehmeriae]